MAVAAVLLFAIAAGVFYVLPNRAGQPSPVRLASTAASQPAASNVPATSARTVIGWTDKEGTQYRAAVEPVRYQEFAEARRRQSVQDLQRLGEAAATRAHVALVPIFEEIEGRVPAFGDWVFDWWTSWKLLGHALGWVWEGVRQGPLLSMPDRVQARLVEEIEQRFDQLVLQPEITEPKLVEALNRILAALGDDLTQQCRSYEELLRAFIAREARRVEKRTAGAEWVPVSAADPLGMSPGVACAAQGGAEDFLVAEFLKLRESRNVDDPVEAVILRMSRPFATKLISYVILPAILTALVGGVALPLLGILPNVISGAVAGVLTGAAGAAIIGFSASTSVDWFLNRTDERRNRGGFEVQVRRAVIASRDSFETKIIDAQRGSIERQLQTFLEFPSVLPPSP